MSAISGAVKSKTMWLAAVTGAVGLIQQATPFIPAKYTGIALAVSGLLTALARTVTSESLGDKAAPAVDVSAKSHWLVGAILFGLVLAALSGCTSLNQSQQQQAGVAVAVDVAVGRVIQGRDTDPVAWSARAHQINDIAVQLKTVVDSGVVALPDVSAKLHELIAAQHFGPADTLAINTAVAALQSVFAQQTSATPIPGTSPLDPTAVTTLDIILSDVVTASRLYMQ